MTGGDLWGAGVVIVGLLDKLAVGRDRGSSEEERLLWLLESFVQKRHGALSHDICRVFANGIVWGLAVMCDTNVEVLVCVGFQEEIRPGVAFHRWLVVIVDAVTIEELAGVVRVIPAVL